MNSLLHDVRFGMRMLAKSPGVTSVALITLALGIGASTAVFSVVKGSILQPVPFADPDALVMFTCRDARAGDEDNLGASVAQYFDWRELCDSYVDVGIYYPMGVNLSGGDHPERVKVIRATASLLSTLGIAAELGRAFTPEEDAPDGPRVALLSDRFWHGHFRGDPDVIGKTIELEGTPYTVLGTLPGSLERELMSFDLWAPLRADPATANRGGVGWIPIARLKDGVSLSEAQAEMNVVTARLEQMHDKLNQDTVTIHRLSDKRFAERDRSAMAILSAAVGLVLLIACANIANLLLARSQTRQSEYAVRAALGATRSRLARLALVESILLALMGSACGGMLAVWGVDVIAAALSADLADYPVRVDTSALLLLGVISIVTAAIFGLPSALTVSRVNLTDSLKAGTRAVSGATASARGRDVLLVTQIAMAFVTVFCAGQLVRSFITVRQIDPGFNSDNLLTMEVSIDRKKYPGNYSKRVICFNAILDRIRRTPGVAAAGAAYITPLIDTDHGNGVVVEGYEGPSGNGEVMVDNVIVTPGYLEALGVPLTRGRFFTPEDVYGAPEVIILSERAAREFWPGEDAIGKRISFGWTQRWPTTAVIGVVGDVTQHGLRRGHALQVYRPMAQGGSYESHMTIVARTALEPRTLADALRQAVWRVDPDQPAYRIRTVKEIIADDTRDLSGLATLLGVCAIIGLIIAGVGLYGVASYLVSQRTREFGVRIALGARFHDVLRLVMLRTTIIVAIGLVVGGGASLALGRVLTAVLYGVAPTDPVTFAVVAAILAAVASVAGFVPARRAAKINPVVALRCD